MAFFTWNDSYSIGIKEFDDQHKQLVALLSKLYEAMQAGKANDVLGGILNELVTYTKTHFAAEERVMKLHAYPEYESHKAEHDALAKKALDLQADFKAGKTTLSLSVGNFLKDWLVTHINGRDKKYAPFLSAKGVK